MRLFLLSSNVPFEWDNSPNVTAVHVVLNELMTGFSYRGYQICLQVLFGPQRKEPLTPMEEAELHRLGSRPGVVCLPPIFHSDAPQAGKSSERVRAVRILRRVFLKSRIEDFYPSKHLQPLVEARIRQFAPSVLLAAWSPEGVAAVHDCRDIPKVSFQGDIDFMPLEARLKCPELFFSARGGVGRWVELARQRARLRQFRRVHWEMMRPLDVIANVTASNASYYASKGHPRSVYVRNLWKDPAVSQWRTLSANGHRPIKIIGHVGGLDTTGSTFGLEFLLKKVMPLLNERLVDKKFEVHVIGSRGQLSPALVPWGRQKNLLFKGFVDDIERELADCDAFLLLNNVGPLLEAFTRHFVAWSMGLCLIVHERSRLAVPEIRPMENALVGATAEEVVQRIVAAVTDSALNARIREGGRKTYEQFFRSDRVVENIAQILESL